MFELGKTFHGAAEWFCSSSLAFKVLRNPVMTSLLITVIALVIIFAFLKVDSTSKRQFRLKTGFWLLMAVSAVTFLHYYALARHLRQSTNQKGVRDIIDSIHLSGTTGGGYQVLSGDPNSLDSLDSLDSLNRLDAPNGHNRLADPEPASRGAAEEMGELVIRDAVLPSAQAPGIAQF